jgi:hypothetical protein
LLFKLGSVLFASFLVVAAGGENLLFNGKELGKRLRSLWPEPGNRYTNATEKPEYPGFCRPEAL